MARAFELGLIGALVALAAAPALAGEAPVAYYPSLGYGQTPPAYAPPRRHERPVFDHQVRVVDGEEAHLPASFFADAGGVGQDEVVWGGGGGYVVGGASAGGYASASASASVHVGVHVGRHGGGPPSHGCGCGGRR